MSRGAAVDDASRVGALPALAFVLIIGDAERFRCGKQIASYLGLVPLEESSGNWRRRLSSENADSIVFVCLSYGTNFPEPFSGGSCRRTISPPNIMQTRILSRRTRVISRPLTARPPHRQSRHGYVRPYLLKNDRSSFDSQEA